MNVKTYIKFGEEGINLPVRGTDNAAGYDVIAASQPEIVGNYNNFSGGYDSIDYIQYKTKIHLSPVGDEYITLSKGKVIYNYATLIFPRSSVSKYNLLLANSIGLCDCDYTGEFLVRFKYIWQPCDLKIQAGAIVGAYNPSKIYQQGDKICQLVLTDTFEFDFEQVEQLPDTKRGSGGFGHTGK